MNPTPENPTFAERYVLSAMMLDVEAVWQVMEVMPSLQMILPKHETIALAIRALAENGKPTDVIATIDELERRGDLNRIGGPAYLHELSGIALTWVNAGFYAEIVHTAAVRTRLHTAAAAIQQHANDPTMAIEVVADKARAAIDQVLELDTSALEDDLDADYLAVVDEIGTTSPGLPTPWPDLTHKLGGLAPGAVYVVAARPSVGKSLIALQIATELERHGYVGYFSLEMTAKENRLRQISQEVGIPLKLLRRGTHLSDEDDQAVRTWVTGRNSRILFDDRSLVTIHDLRHKVRTWARKYPLSGIVVDYLQLLTASDTTGDNRNNQISEISRNLKIIAREFEVPLIVLSQLNRGIEHRSDRTPNLADLRDSGAIEQDADAVLFLADETPPGERFGLQMTALDIIIAKNRSGETGLVELMLELPCVRAYPHPNPGRRDRG